MNTAKIIPFRFDAQEIRTLLIDDQPWFFAIDVCLSIALGDTNKALIGLDDDEKREHEHYSGSGRKPVLINESGLYSLILRSRKVEAKRFKKWVTSEVLPSIRKHGFYADENDSLNTLVNKTIGTNGFRCLSAVLEGKYKHLPKQQKTRIKQHVWAQTRKSFSVVSVRDIPADQIDSARNFIAAYVVEGEWLGKEPEKYALTRDQALKLDGLLHSVAWVAHRWNNGVGKGIEAVNVKLHRATFEHVSNMRFAAECLDESLNFSGDFTSSSALRPKEYAALFPYSEQDIGVS